MAHDTMQPVAGCTLSAADLQRRQGWIAELNQAALLHHRRDDLRLELVYAAGAREQVQQLVRSEQACCAFLAFAVHNADDGVHLIIETPESTRGTADKLFAAFCARMRSQMGCACCGGTA